MQKYGQLANQFVSEPFVCLVCDGAHGFNWSDAHGEGMCNNCGTPYNLKSDPPRMNIKADWLPTLRRYFSETSAYMGLGQIMIARDYPECIEGQRKFSEWLKRNPDAVPPPDAPPPASDSASSTGQVGATKDAGIDAAGSQGSPE